MKFCLDLHIKFHVTCVTKSPDNYELPSSASSLRWCAHKLYIRRAEALKRIVELANAAAVSIADLSSQRPCRIMRPCICMRMPTHISRTCTNGSPQPSSTERYQPSIAHMNTRTHIRTHRFTQFTVYARCLRERCERHKQKNTRNVCTRACAHWRRRHRRRRNIVRFYALPSTQRPLVGR